MNFHPEPDTPEPSRRFQYSLLELFGLTTSIAVGLSLLKCVPDLWPLVVAVEMFVLAKTLERHHLSIVTVLIVLVVSLVAIGGFFLTGMLPGIR